VKGHIWLFGEGACTGYIMFIFVFATTCASKSFSGCEVRVFMVVRYTMLVLQKLIPLQDSMCVCTQFSACDVCVVYVSVRVRMCV
jgi:hypothetical protein